MKKIILAILGLLLCGNIAAANEPHPADPFFDAQGQYAIGTRYFTWNAPNKEGSQYIGQIWYPAENTAAAKKAGYLPASINKANLAKNNPMLASLQTVTTGAMLDAPPLSSPARYPVLIYSPGLGLIGQAGTFFFEYLASRGFIVAAINHPGSSYFTENKNGSLVLFKQADYNNEQIKTEITQTRATELSAALDALLQLNNNPASDFYQKIDTANAGVFGHSIGGRTALRAAAIDKRFKAAADLDGSIEEEPPYTFTKQEFLMIETDVKEEIQNELAAGTTKPEEIPQIKNEYNQSMKNLFDTPDAKGYLFDYKHTCHYNYTDMPILFKTGEGLGAADGVTVLLSVSNLLEDFFNEAFFHPESSLESKIQQYPYAALKKAKNNLSGKKGD
jgi:predicted dienelactone hydrolase